MATAFRYRMIDLVSLVALPIMMSIVVFYSAYEAYIGHQYIVSLSIFTVAAGTTLASIVLWSSMATIYIYSDKVICRWGYFFSKNLDWSNVRLIKKVRLDSAFVYPNEYIEIISADVRHKKIKMKANIKSYEKIVAIINERARAFSIDLSIVDMGLASKMKSRAERKRFASEGIRVASL